MVRTLRFWLSGSAAALLWLAASGAQAQAYVNATVGGEIAPGVYGRINIGNTPPPLLYPQPVVVYQPAMALPRSPIYLYVPPGHAKNWRKHCARYNACQQPVYFVKEPPRRGPQGGPGWGEQRRDGDRMQGNRFDDRDNDRRDDRQDRGHGRGNGNGKHRD